MRAHDGAGSLHLERGLLLEGALCTDRPEPGGGAAACRGGVELVLKEAGSQVMRRRHRVMHVITRLDVGGSALSKALDKVEAKAKNTLAGFAEGDELRMMLAALKRFTKNNDPVNTIAARRRIADGLIAANTYSF